MARPPLPREIALVLLLAVALCPTAAAQHGSEAPAAPAPIPDVPQADPPPCPPPAPEDAAPAAVAPGLPAPPWDGPGLGIGAAGPPGVPFVRYGVMGFPDERVAGQPTSLGYVRQDLAVSVPLWQDGPDRLSLTGNVRSELFHTGAVLPATGQSFPDDLWNIQLGVTYGHHFDNGWTAGGGLSAGSASDQPFHSIEELTAGAHAFLRIPSGEHDAWLFSVFYSPTSQLPFPVPGVAYVYQPSDSFRMNIGLPFQLMYRPIDDVTLDLSYMLLTTVHAQAGYRPCPRLQVYVSYDWENESYFLADRPDEQERLFYYDMRLTAGARLRLGGHGALDLLGGYVFDRFYFEGRSFSDRGQDRIDVGAGPFLGARFLAWW